MSTTATNNNVNNYAQMALTDFSAGSAVRKMIAFPGTSFWSLHFTMTTVRKFFLTQWFQKIKLTRYPVINVESPLDAKIPFVPEKITTYMDFSAFFCRILGMLYKRVGMAKATKYSNEFFKLLTKEYSAAKKIYTYCMTTTNRPDYEEMEQFVKIHKTDPHYMCVPSLHVTIATAAYMFAKHNLKDYLPEEEAEMRLEEIRKEALAIVESVLYVKQHSVTCIPSALYMLSATTASDFFTADDASEFINELFTDKTELTEEVSSEIREYFYYIYERELLQSVFEDSWDVPVKTWLDQHAEETSQTIG